MFTVVRDNKYLAFTLASDPAAVYPVIRHFEDLAPEWGIDHSERIAVVLRELLSNAVIHGNRRDPARKVRCWIERTPEGPLKITVEDEGAGFDFGRVNTTMPVDPRKIHQRGYVLIHRICRNLNINARGNRVTALVDATEAAE